MANRKKEVSITERMRDEMRHEMDKLTYDR